MKLNSLGAPCLLLLLLHTPFLLARRGGGSGRSFSSKKSSSSSRDTTHTNTAKNHNHGSTSHGGYPKQHGQNNEEDHRGGAGNQGYPRHHGGGSPYGRGYGSYGGHGYGGYPGGYINHNPNNKILSPHYGGSIGYGGYGTRGGSPFSHSVHSLGYMPSDKSRGFGRTAVMAAAGGAVAGMAVGYGLGRFPRPHFHFHNAREEYYYNQYMYKKYSAKSADTNDYSRESSYNPPAHTYDSYMKSCMKRTDLLPATSQKPKNKPVGTTTKSDTVASAADDTAKANSSAAEASAPSTPRPGNQPKVSPMPPSSLTINSAEDDDDTVSIEEIGYPALIEQLKVKRCVELYMSQSGGAQGLKLGFQGLLVVVMSTMLMLMNSDVLMSLH